MSDGIDGLRTGRVPELARRRAPAATELIFAIYESSHRRARIALPLTESERSLVERPPAATPVE